MFTRSFAAGQCPHSWGIAGVVVFAYAFCADDVRAQKRGAEPEPAQPDIMTKIEDLNVRHRTQHYALAGTIDQKKFEEYGRALEFIHKEYVKGFDNLLKEEKKNAGGTKPGARPTAKKPPATKSKPGKAGGGQTDDRAGKETGADDDAEADKDRFRVLFFKNDKEYQSFGKAYLGNSTEHTDGMFVPALKTLFITEKKDVNDTYALLFHEAFHQFVDRHIANPPTWLNEGLATYYGSAKPTARGLDWSNPPKSYWWVCRQAIQFNGNIPVLEVINASRAEFYDTTPVKMAGTSDRLIRRNLFYAESYTLIHVLISDKGGLTKLQNFIRDLSQDDGTHTRRITEKHFSEQACQQLEQAWIKFVKNRNDRSANRRP